MSGRHGEKLIVNLRRRFRVRSPHW